MPGLQASAGCWRQRAALAPPPLPPCPPAALILVPTRELALQTSQVCKELGKHMGVEVRSHLLAWGSCLPGAAGLLGAPSPPWRRDPALQQAAPRSVGPGTRAFRSKPHGWAGCIAQLCMGSA